MMLVSGYRFSSMSFLEENQLICLLLTLPVFSSDTNNKVEELRANLAIELVVISASTLVTGSTTETFSAFNKVSHCQRMSS